MASLMKTRTEGLPPDELIGVFTRTYLSPTMRAYVFNADQGTRAGTVYATETKLADGTWGNRQLTPEGTRIYEEARSTDTMMKAASSGAVTIPDRPPLFTDPAYLILVLSGQAARGVDKGYRIAYGKAPTQQALQKLTDGKWVAVARAQTDRSTNKTRWVDLKTGTYAWSTIPYYGPPDMTVERAVVQRAVDTMPFQARAGVLQAVEAERRRIAEWEASHPPSTGTPGTTTGFAFTTEQAKTAAAIGAGLATTAATGNPAAGYAVYAGANMALDGNYLDAAKSGAQAAGVDPETIRTAEQYLGEAESLYNRLNSPDPRVRQAAQAEAQQLSPTEGELLKAVAQAKARVGSISWLVNPAGRIVRGPFERDDSGIPGLVVAPNVGIAKGRWKRKVS